MALTAANLLSSSHDELTRANRIYVAFSGGLDSSVLLHAIASSFAETKITAVHINHGLSGNSDHWQQHCQSVCERLAINCITKAVNIDRLEAGVENAARQARYQIFEGILTETDCLVMAHHLDDQVETAIYRLLRGSGPRGMAAIPAGRSLGRGVLMRPFLSFPRSELEQYAVAHGVEWVNDESNQQVDFDRNYLRHEVIPVLSRRWPDYRRRISRSSALSASATEALEELGDIDLRAVDERRENGGYSIDIHRLLALSKARQQNLINCWVRRHDLDPIGHAVYQQLFETLIPASADANPRIVWQSGEFRRFRERLFLLTPQVESVSTSQHIPLDLQGEEGEISLPDGSTLRWQRGQGDTAVAVNPQDQLCVGFRRGGEYGRPVSRSCGATLKKLLNEYAVVPWLRNRLPLVYVNGELAAAADLFVCREYACRDAQQGICFHWQVSD